MKIYILRFRMINISEKDGQLLQFVSENRKNKIMKYCFEIDRKLSLYAALLLKMGLIANFNLKNSQIEIALDRNGKPYLLKTDEIKFNLSHTKSAVICGFSQNDIGIDVEKVAKPCYDIMPICFHIDEIKKIQNLEIENRPLFFYKVWTRKEAYGKWNGLGFYQDLRKINSLERHDEFNIRTWNDGEYCFSVCCKSQMNNVELIELSEEDVYNFFVDFNKN